VVTQLQATVAGRTAAVLATPAGIGDVSDRWLSDAQELADALPASAAATVRARVAAVEAEIVSAAERDIKVHVAERDYDAAVSRAASASDAYPSGARIAAWAEKKDAALQAQSDAWEAAEAARQAAEERREAARQAAEERREAARQEEEERREAARERRSSNAPSGSWDRYENGSFTDSCSASLPGQGVSCNSLIARCKWSQPSDVGACIVNAMSYGGLSPQQCLNCWR
jgi:colicin import membrane protein